MKIRELFVLCLLTSSVLACEVEDDDRDVKPAWFTAEERADLAVSERSLTGPPAPALYPPAEYARQQGLLLNIPSQSNMYPYFGTIIRTVVDSGAIPFILVHSTGWADSVYTNVLAPRSVRRDQVRFIVMSNSQFWARDYGPWHVYQNGQRIIVDQLYGFGWRDSDDKVPINLGNVWSEPVYTTDINTEGGNFMTDGRGSCWASTGVLEADYNDLPQAEVEAMYKGYLGCATITFVPPLPNEGTTHIDMFSKILNQDTIMVAYTSAALGGFGDEIAHLDQVAELYRTSPKPGGGPWNIVRVPMTFASGIQDQRTPNSHTNALIFNGYALVPTYGAGTDEEALAAYTAALPQHTIVPVDSSVPIWYGGAVHCTTMQIPPAQYSACGDGVVLGAESCEANYLNGATCQALGFAGGSLRCSVDCAFDVSGCTGASQCRNGVVDAGEACDGGSLACTDLDRAKYESGVAVCKADCTGYDLATCVLKPVGNSCTAAACVTSPAKAIPDNNASGLVSTIPVENFNANLAAIEVRVNITHTYRGDLVVTLTSPSGTASVLHNRAGGSADNLSLVVSPTAWNGQNPQGNWTLKVQDLASSDTGRLESWSIKLTPATPPVCGNGAMEGAEVCDSGPIACTALNAVEYEGGTASCASDCGSWIVTDCVPRSEQNSCVTSPCENTTVTSIPDNNATGITSTISVASFGGVLASVTVKVSITHTYRGDLVVKLVSPKGTAYTLHNKTGGSADNLALNVNLTTFNAESPVGSWKLQVQDRAASDVGKLVSWSLQLR